MNPTRHPTNNHEFVAPVDWDQGATPCSTLPVTLGEDHGGLAVMASYWQPTQEELTLLLQGKPVMLMVYSLQHPVVALGVEA